ncbi:4-hydroxy-tetrahydrodipicolinate synthase [Labrys neptuniae]
MSIVKPGAYTALVTPFDRHGAVDDEAFFRLAERQLAAGIAGLALFGCTGEEATMPLEDRVAALKALRRRLPGEIPLIAGGGASDTRVAVNLARTLADEGADAILSVVPPYNRPVTSGLIRHFSEIADRSPVPVIISNVPGRTGQAIGLEASLALAGHGNILGMDEGSGDMGFAMRLLRDAPPGFLVFSGEDELTLALMALGGAGALSLVSNEVPGKVAALVAHAQGGDYAQAIAIHNEILDLSALNYAETNPAPVKAALAMMGLIEEHLRLPMVPLSEGRRQPLRDELAKLGLL